jgi:two-component system, OmpR family, response regulator MprA
MLLDDPVRPRLLVVEDDGAVRRALQRALALHGFEVRAVADGLEALRAFASAEPDLLVLDVGLPGPDGMRLAQRLRADGYRLPILMLTARVEVADRVAGLDSGADDYLTKPFALDELVARVRALLRRTTHATATGRSLRVLRVGDIELDTDGHAVRGAGQEVALTPSEFALLELLLAAPGRVCSREVLADELWGGGEVGSNALEQHVAGLRRKLEATGAARIVHTVRGVGYVARAAS